MSTILSIDYGTKRIGVAFSDPGRIFAFPYGVIENKNLQIVLSEIKEIVEEKEVGLIVVGMPYNMNNTKGEMANNVDEFICALGKVVNVEIQTVDERLSSFQAEENLKERGLNAKEIKKVVDSEAARVILEDYLAQ